MNSKSLIIRNEELAKALGVSKTTLWRMCRDKKMPLPISLSDRVVGWRRTDIENWLEQK